MERLHYVQEFLANERAEGKAAATLRNHRRSLEQLEGWLCSNNGKGEQEVGGGELIAFVNHLRDRYTPDSVNNCIAAARLYFRWLVEMGLREDEQNPARRLKFVPVRPKPVEALTNEDVRKLIAWVGKARKERFGVYRSSVLALFLVDTGLRIGEALGLKLQDIDLGEGKVLVRANKTKSLRLVPLSATMQGYLRRYLARRKEHFTRHKLADGGSLFPSEQGGLFLRDTAEAGIRQVAKQAKVPLLRPHRLRHTFARLCLLNGMPLPALMRIGGWKKLQTVSRYTYLTDEQCAEVHAVSSPLAGLRR